MLKSEEKGRGWGGGAKAIEDKSLTEFRHD